jgi:hypothetical protein
MPTHILDCSFYVISPPCPLEWPYGYYQTTKCAPLYATCAQMSERIRLAAVAKEEPVLKTLGRQGFRRRGHIVRGDLRAPFCVNNLWMCSERWLVTGRVLKPHWLERWLTGSRGGKWTRYMSQPLFSPGCNRQIYEIPKNKERL